MIVATHFGLFMPALRPDWEDRLRAGLPELQVRARRRKDLDHLRDYMDAHGLELSEPIALGNTDYQYRAYCTRSAWGQALALLAVDIDYTKFKDTPAKYHGDHALTAAYEKIWTATFSSFPHGSTYHDAIPRQRAARVEPRQYGKPQRTRQEWQDEFDKIVGNETVEITQTETVRYTKMRDLSDAQLAALMKEIDGSTGPSEGQAPPRDANGNIIHTWCDHPRTKNARRKCREYWKNVD